MNSPPGVCDRCGYLGPVPGFHIENSTNITFVGNSGDCPKPRCGGRMNIIDGTYDFIDDVVRLVRDADLSADRLRGLSSQLSVAPSPEAFAEANPDLAPIVQAIVAAAAARGRGAQWARDLLLVLSIVLASYFGVKQVNLAQEQVDLARDQLRQNPLQHQVDDRTTRTLSDSDIDRVAEAVRREMEAGVRRTGSAPPRPRRKSQASRTKNGKTHGRDKRRRR